MRNKFHIVGDELLGFFNATCNFCQREFHHQTIDAIRALYEEHPCRELTEIAVLNKCRVLGCSQCPGSNKVSFFPWLCTCPCHDGAGQEDVSAYQNSLRRAFLSANELDERQE